MLIEMYKYVIENREKMLEKLNKGDCFKKAKRYWRKFSDEINNYMGDEVNISDTNGMLIGIDSSWNLIPYHGYYLYAVNAVAIAKADEDFVKPKYEIEIDTLSFEENGKPIYNPRLVLESKGMEKEHELIKESINKKDKTDIILVDGSLQARIYDNRIKKNIYFHEFAKDTLEGRDDIIFIAKRTESRSMINGIAGDIYYFDHATNEAGYSYYYDKNITIVYARFADGEPCVKVEFYTRLKEDIILDRLLRIKEGCIAGYPYVLKMAHERCKISNNDMKVIEQELGLQLEVGGREVME